MEGCPGRYRGSIRCSRRRVVITSRGHGTCNIPAIDGAATGAVDNRDRRGQRVGPLPVYPARQTAQRGIVALRRVMWLAVLGNEVRERIRRATAVSVLPVRPHVGIDRIQQRHESTAKARGLVPPGPDPIYGDNETTGSMTAARPRCRRTPASTTSPNPHRFGLRERTRTLNREPNVQQPVKPRRDKLASQYAVARARAPRFVQQSGPYVVGLGHCSHSATSTIPRHCLERAEPTGGTHDALRLFTFHIRRYGSPAMTAAVALVDS